MQRVPFCVVTVLILSCCLAFSLFASPQAFAGVVKAQHDLRVATVVAIPSHQDHELTTDHLPLVLDSGDEVGTFDKRVDIANDLRRIYTGPIEVKGSDLCLLMIGAGTMLLMDEDIYDMINSGPKSPEDRQISGIVTDGEQPLSFGNLRAYLYSGPGDCLPCGERSGLFRDSLPDTKSSIWTGPAVARRRAALLCRTPDK